MIRRHYVRHTEPAGGLLIARPVVVRGYATCPHCGTRLMRDTEHDLGCYRCGYYAWGI